MRKIALIPALAFPLAGGMALTSAFVLGLLPLLSTDPCYVAKEGTPHFVAIEVGRGLPLLVVT